MRAKARLLGHPIHQMLIPLPLGLFSAAVFFDIARLVTADTRFGEVAYNLIPVGVATGLAAAVFGIIDFMIVPRGTRARRIGLLHGATNALVVTLFYLSWVLRPGSILEPGPLAYALCFAGGGVSVLSGWLGGELVGRLGIGVDEGAHPDAPSSLTAPPPGGVPH